MALAPVTQVVGRAVPVPGDDVDTDRIIPARFMKCITFDGLGAYAFHDERFAADGSSKGHPLDAPQHAGASILVSGSNFGCGSSREHAPQSLLRFGIRAVIAESFAEIFFGNSIQLGMPCLRLSRADREDLSAFAAAHPATEFTVDVAAATISGGGRTWKGILPDGPRTALLAGRWDPIADLLEGDAAIAATAARLPYLAGR